MSWTNMTFLYRSTFRDNLSILHITCENAKKLFGTWERITRTYIYVLGSQRVKVCYASMNAWPLHAPMQIWV